jgi:hypothetical protein
MWVDAAIKLQERDLKMMDRLVRAQQRNALETAGSPMQLAHSVPSVTRLVAVGGDD